jgi:hypothetical protein
MFFPFVSNTIYHLFFIIGGYKMHPAKQAQIKLIKLTDLSKKANVSAGYLSRVVSGDIDAFKDTALKLAEAANFLSEQKGLPVCFEPNDFNKKLHANYKEIYPDAKFRVRSVLCSSCDYEVKTAKEILDYHTADLLYTRLYELMSDALRYSRCHTFTYADHIYYFEGEEE